jgi:hypothetical protein
MTDMRNAADYRKQAAVCRREAEKAPDPFFRRQWNDLAEAYDLLASHFAREAPQRSQPTRTVQ